MNEQEVSIKSIQADLDSLKELYRQFYKSRHQSKDVTHYDPADPVIKEILELEMKLREFYKIPFVLEEAKFDESSQEISEARA